MDRLGVAIPVHVLRGGQIDNDYADALAAEAVIVGTLDQVVSRQLMRGYCCSPWSWPRHFAALNNDVRVVVVETQLQGAAVRTAIRLQELHQELGGPAPRELVLCSATHDAAILPPGIPRHGLSDVDYGHPVAERKVGRAKPLTTTTAGSKSCSPTAQRRPWRWRWGVRGAGPRLSQSFLRRWTGWGARSDLPVRPRDSAFAQQLQPGDGGVGLADGESAEH